LECATEDDPDLFPSIKFYIRYPSEYPSGEETRDDKYPSLFIMQANELIEREIGLEREAVTDLSTHDSEISERTSHFMDESSVTYRGKTLKSERLQSITYEERERLTICLPDSEFSSAVLIIV